MNLSFGSSTYSLLHGIVWQKLMVFLFYFFIPNIFVWAHQAPTKQLPFSNKQINLSAAYVDKSPRDKEKKHRREKTKEEKTWAGSGVVTQKLRAKNKRVQ